MKWSIAGLMVLGLLAAVCATLLVSAVMARTDAGPSGQAQVVQVVVAKRAMPAMSVVEASSVEVREVARADAPSGHLGDTLEGVGKVLALPVVEGQPLTRSLFVSAGSGLELAATLPEGMRAVSLSLANDSGMVGLIGPGATVDVIASFKTGSSGRSGEAVSVTLLQGVQVLGLEQQTVVSPATGDEKTLPSANPGKRLVVTLKVDLEQAQALQLATQYGEVSLAMRNPLDATKSDVSMVALKDLARLRGGPIQPAAMSRLFQESENRVLNSLGDIIGEASAGDAAEEPASANHSEMSMARNRVWRTTVLRGRAAETQTFELAD